VSPSYLVCKVCTGNSILNIPSEYLGGSHHINETACRVSITDRTCTACSLQSSCLEQDCHSAVGLGTIFTVPFHTIFTVPFQVQVLPTLKQTFLYDCTNYWSQSNLMIALLVAENFTPFYLSSTYWKVADLSQIFCTILLANSVRFVPSLTFIIL
jgi:hypothetical protein